MRAAQAVNYVGAGAYHFVTISSRSTGCELCTGEALVHQIDPVGWVAVSVINNTIFTCVSYAEARNRYRLDAVSYTHLTLPTIYSV